MQTRWKGKPMEMRRIERVQDESPRFPIGLLLAGYTTGAAAGLAVFVLGGGLLHAGLIFWLSGAVATLSWGVLGMLLRRSTVRRSAQGPRQGNACPSSNKIGVST